MQTLTLHPATLVLIVGVGLPGRARHPIHTQERPIMSTAAGSTPQGRDPKSPRPPTRPPASPPDATDRDDRAGHHTTWDGDTSARDPREVVARQQEQFGGIKPGSAFFGWLTATGTAVLLTALVAAGGVALGLATDTTLDQASTSASADTQTVGITGAVILAVILFIAYFCGGYVAGRMARFNGAKQGLAVWLWAALIAGLVALAAAIAGNKYDVLSQVNTFPRIPIDAGTLTTGGVVALVVAAVVALLAAVLGGITGMRYHRRIDDATPDLARDHGDGA